MISDNFSNFWSSKKRGDGGEVKMNKQGGPNKGVEGGNFPQDK